MCSSNAIRKWLRDHCIEWYRSPLGKSTQNGFVESFSGRLRNECINEHLFHSYSHAHEIIEEWRADYNLHRPRASLKELSPNEFITRSKKRA